MPNLIKLFHSEVNILIIFITFHPWNFKVGVIMVLMVLVWNLVTSYQGGRDVESVRICVLIVVIRPDGYLIKIMSSMLTVQHKPWALRMWFLSDWIRRPSFQLTTIKTAPDTSTEVDSVDTQVNNNGGSAVTISDCISSKNWCNFEFKFEITGHYCKL